MPPSTDTVPAEPAELQPYRADRDAPQHGYRPGRARRAEQRLVEEDRLKSFAIYGEECDGGERDAGAGRKRALHLAAHERVPLGGFDFGEQPVAHVKEHGRREQHRRALDRLALARRDLEEQLDQRPGEEARGDGKPGAAGHIAPPLGRAGLGEERHQRGNDQDRLEAFAHQQEERGNEQAHRRRPVGHDALGALDARQQPPADRLALGGVGAWRTGAQPRERPLELACEPRILRTDFRLHLLEREIGRPLELAREPRILRADFGLHLLEREIGVEGDLVGTRRERGIDLAAHGRERRAGRGAAVLHRPHVGGDGPAVVLGNVLGKFRHRRPGNTDGDLAEDLEQRRPPHHGGIGEIRGRRAFDRLRFRAVAAAGCSMTGGAALAKHLGAARERGRPRRQRLDGMRAAHGRGDASDQRIGHASHRVRRGQAVEQLRNQRERALRFAARGAR